MTLADGRDMLSKNGLLTFATVPEGYFSVKMLSPYHLPKKAEAMCEL